MRRSQLSEIWLPALRRGLLLTAALACMTAPAQAEPCRPKALRLSGYVDHYLPAASTAARFDLRARFMGITTILLDDGETQILVDGFFTRPSLREMVMGKIAPDRDKILDQLRAADATRLKAVLVAHAHHDHAMDAPLIADEKDALLVGSESVINLGRGHGLAESQLRAVRDGERIVVGKFAITPFSVAHAKPSLFKGHLRRPLQTPARVFDYREGRNFAYLIEHEGRRILIHPTATSEPGLYRDVEVDIIFLGVGRLGRESEAFADDYWQDVVAQTKAKIIIPVHWDHLAKPLTSPMTPMPFLLDDVRMGIGRIRCRAEAHGVALKMAPTMDAIDLPLPPRSTAPKPPGSPAS